MKFFVTGVNGQLGHDVIYELKKRGYEAFGSDIQECCNAEMPYISLDITDEKAVDAKLKELRIIYEQENQKKTILRESVSL